MVPNRLTPVTVKVTTPRLSLDSAVNTAVPLSLVTEDTVASEATPLMPAHVPTTVAPGTAFPAASLILTDTIAAEEVR